jgi:hypothetical protein
MHQPAIIMCHLVRFLAALCLLAATAFTVCSAAGSAIDPSTDSLWKWGAPTLQGDDIHAMAASPSINIAVGKAGRLLLSRDNQDWQLGNSRYTKDLYSCFWDGKQFLVGGFFGAILLSPDGVNWTHHTADRTFNVLGLASNGSTYVAVGNKISIQTSSDGKTWKLIKEDEPQNGGLKLNCVAWTGSYYLAAGDGGRCYTSENGEVWTKQSLPTQGNVLCMTVLQNQVFLFDSQGAVFVSVDGINWSTRELPNKAVPRAVSWNGSKFVILTVGRKVLQSPDLLQWTETAMSNIELMNALLWDGKSYAAMGNKGHCYLSKDASSWERLGKDSPTSNVINNIVWGGNQFVASTYYGELLSSADGTDWGSRIKTGAIFCGLAYKAGQWVYLGKAGIVYTSTDGIVWNKEANLQTTNLLALAAGDKLFMAVGNGGEVYTSPDGKIWTKRNAPESYSLTTVKWINDRFVSNGSGSTNTIMSVDGTSWSTQAWSSKQVDPLSIVSNGTISLGISDDFLAWSEDGQTWTTMKTESYMNEGWKKLLWDGKRFISYTGSLMRTSLDGKQWTTINQRFSTPLSALASNGETLVAGTIDGTFIYNKSPDFSGPVVDEISESLSLTEGQELLLEAKAHGDGQLYYQWNRGEDFGTIPGAIGPRFRIAQVRPQDNDIYWCTVSSATGTTASKSLRVTVYALPPVISLPAQKPFALGEPVSLAPLNYAAGSLQFQWYKDGVALPQEKSLSLRINSLKSEDLGTYVLVAINGTGTRTSNPIQVQASLAPKMTWTAQKFGYMIDKAQFYKGSLYYYNDSENCFYSSDDLVHWQIRPIELPRPNTAYKFQATEKGLLLLGTHSYYSTDCTTWSDLGPSGNFTAYVAAADSKRIIAGFSSVGFLSSTDGITWSKLKLPSNFWPSSILYNGSVWMLYSSSSGYLSRDGITWTPMTMPATWSLQNILCQGGVFRATYHRYTSTVGYHRLYETLTYASRDGLTWSSSDMDFWNSYARLKDDLVIIYGAVGSVQVGTSLDDLSTFSVPDNLAIKAITATGSHYVGSTASGKRMISSDCKQWTLLEPSSRAPASLSTMAALADNLFFTEASSTAPYQFFTSDEKLNFKAAQGIQNIRVRALAYSGSLFLAVANSGTLLTSKDAITWSAPLKINHNDLYCATWTGSLFVTAGDNGFLATSPDGVNWSIQDSGTTSRIIQLASSQSRILALDLSGRVLSSADAATWTIPPELNSNTFHHRVLYDGSRFLLSSRNTQSATGSLRSSKDGLAWQTYDLGSLIPRFMASNGGSIMIADTKGPVFMSSDMQEWTQHLLPLTKEIQDLHSLGKTWFVQLSDSTLVIASEPLIQPTQFLSQPQSQAVYIDSSIDLKVEVSGTPGFFYQWKKDGQPIPGAVAPLLRFSKAKESDSGSYSVLVTSAAGATESLAASLVVAPPTKINALSSAQSLSAGSRLDLSVSASGASNLAYQWYRNGKAIPGATQAKLELPLLRTTDAGLYHVKVTGPADAISTESIRVDVARALLSALSVRAEAGPEADMLFVGVITDGIADNEKLPVLVRGLGPELSGSLSNFLPDPELRLYNNDKVLASNDDWDPVQVGALLRQLYQSIKSGSKDAALAADLLNGVYTTGLGPKNKDRGVVLCDLYSANPDRPGHLMALSVRAKAGAGESTLIAGLMLSGVGKSRILVRGLGPALAAVLSGKELADPRLELRSLDGTLLGSNDNWGNDPLLADAFLEAGLSALPSNSKDAALVLTLGPGLYTISLSGAANSTGLAMIEMYQLP